MSKVRINDLAREMEVKSRQILEVLTELGLGEGKTHSSSIEEHEADKVRAHFGKAAHAGAHTASGSGRAPQGIQPKIDLSHVHKPGDVTKAILAKKQADEEAARRSQVSRAAAAKPAASAPAVKAAPAKP
ncbi:MAG: translation initiation factor IF-2 N-terminal domain-containing protein, partial [Terracidiphilus sp.]